MTEAEPALDPRSIEPSSTEPSSTELRSTEPSSTEPSSAAVHVAEAAEASPPVVLRADTTVRVATRIAARVIDGTAVLIINDEQDIHTLNSVGTFVFEQLDAAPKSVAELARATHEAFDVEAALADEHVREFVVELVRLGAFEVAEP